MINVRRLPREQREQEHIQDNAGYLMLISLNVKKGLYNHYRVHQKSVSLVPRRVD